MNYLFLVVRLLLATVAHAQATLVTPVQYGTLLAAERRFAKVELLLDYGQASNAQTRAASLAGADTQLR